MVDKIYDIKARVLDRMQQSISERGIERMDVNEMGKLADVVKDLSEAEESCWEAEYYRSVTEAMGSGYMGYEDAATRDRRGYQRPMEQSGYSLPGGSTVTFRQGDASGYRDSQGQYASRRGYMDGPYGHTDPMQDVRQMMQSADPQERERIKAQLRQMAEM